MLVRSACLWSGFVFVALLEVSQCFSYGFAPILDSQAQKQAVRLLAAPGNGKSSTRFSRPLLAPLQATRTSLSMADAAADGGELEKPKGGGSSMSTSTFNLIKACVGSGVLSLPGETNKQTNKQTAGFAEPPL